MKKTIMVLNAFLVMSLFVVSFADNKAGAFNDVPINHSASVAVNLLAKKGIIEGYGDGRFIGNRAMTRYESVMCLARMLNIIQVMIDTNFYSSITKVIKNNPEIRNLLKSDNGKDGKVVGLNDEDKITLLKSKELLTNYGPEISELRSDIRNLNSKIASLDAMINEKYKIISLLDSRIAVLETAIIDKNKDIVAQTTTPIIKINPKDGAEMILIPTGEFLMGSKDVDKNARDNEKPQRKVYLDAYYMYKTEVTVAQYRKFCVATNREMPKEPDWKWHDNHPVVFVTWNDAKAYADWAGVALPSEAQWEKAARGTDGRIYPWGSSWDVIKCVNLSNSSGAGNTSSGTHSVGSFPIRASPYGVMDMGGNVWEWCADWYGADYYKNAPTMNPIGPATGNHYVLRGGSWVIYYDNSDFNRGASRFFSDPDGDGYYIGFRCAVSSPGP